MIFISWSGDRAKAIADVLESWIPDVAPGAETWVSTGGIPKGAESDAKIQEMLDLTSTGIVVVNPENQFAPWLNYESGAIGAKAPRKAVWTLLDGMEPRDLQRPLSRFQATVLADKSDVAKLVSEINKRNPIAGSADAGRVSRWLDKAWPDLVSRIEEIEVPAPAADRRDVADLVEEILEIARATSQTVGDLSSEVSQLSAQADLNRVLRRFTGKDRLDVPVNLESVALADLRRAESTPLSRAGNPLASVASQSGYAGGQGLHGQLALIGKRVRHAQRGLGTVMDVVAESDGERAKVQFDTQEGNSIIPLGDLTMVYENPSTAPE